MINMTMTAIHKNNSSFLRQPSKQGSASESIERTAWPYLPVSSCPTVVHSFEGSGWYSSTWHTKMISLLSSFYCKPTSSIIQRNFQIITSDLSEEPSQPPVSLILPPTIEALAPVIVLGKEASGVQSCAPRRRVSTDDPSDPAQPPATMNAWNCQIITGCPKNIAKGTT